MARLLITLDDQRARETIGRLLRQATNAQPLYQSIGRVLINRVRMCFRLGIDPWGDAWRPIKWRAARTREDGSRTRTGRRQSAANARGQAGQPLRDTGRLNRSITSRPEANGVTVGTNVMYARTHQFGAVIRPVRAQRLAFPGPNGQIIFAKRVTVPARPFLPIRKGGQNVDLPPAWSKLVVQTIRAYFVNSLNTRGG